MLNVKIFLFSFFLLLIIFVSFYVIRLLLGLNKNNSESINKNSSQVGFVVNTFHDLVTRLKEKEKELEYLKNSAEKRASSIELYNENIFQSVPSGILTFNQEKVITKIKF